MAVSGVGDVTPVGPRPSAVARTGRAVAGACGTLRSGVGGADRVPGLRRAIPRVKRMQPDVVLFTSWQGRHADSPRAICEELRRRDAPFELVWLLADESLAPSGTTGVRCGTVAHLEQLGRARYVVSNNSMPGWFRKRSGAWYVQTWHGTPLKRIAFDIEEPRFSGSRRYLESLRREVTGWDYLVAQNRFSTEVLRRAFRYEGRVLETGYPRNDILSAPERDAVAAAIRRELGVPEGNRVVLYAPTWRDGLGLDRPLDLAELVRTFGADHTFLVRSHALEGHALTDGLDPAVRDVSDRHDVTELLLAADVLVTDYSSVMFDFAVTRKPMLFYTPDLVEYRDNIRGFCFDFESSAPGPLMTTTAEVAAALRDIDSVAAAAGPAYERFRERFCHLDDGAAAARVVDAVFGL